MEAVAVAFCICLTHEHERRILCIDNMSFVYEAAAYSEIA